MELGTGKYAKGERRTKWVYVDENGVGHTTEGQNRNHISSLQPPTTSTSTEK